MALKKLSNNRLISFAIGLIAIHICLFVQIGAQAHPKYHGVKGEAKLNYDSLYNSAVSLEKSSEGKEIINKCIEAYGGMEKLEKIKSLKYQWKMFPNYSKDSITVIKEFSQNRKYKIIQNWDRGIEAKLLNDKMAWSITSDTIISISGPQYTGKLFSYLVMKMPQAMKNESFSEIRYGMRDSDSLGYIYMLKKDSLMIVVGIDPSDNLIKQTEGIVLYEGGSSVYINRFSNFKEIEGYLFPQNMIDISMGLIMGKSSLEDVKINVNFPESEFEPARVKKLSNFD